MTLLATLTELLFETDINVTDDGGEHLNIVIDTIKFGVKYTSTIQGKDLPFDVTPMIAVSMAKPTATLPFSYYRADALFFDAPTLARWLIAFKRKD